MKKKVKQIGEIGVDAGLCWIGDPCYVLHAEPKPKAIGADWGEFCDILHKDKQFPTAMQFNYDLGHPGLGVAVSTGYGDGVYPVFAQYGHEGRIAKVWIEFMDDETDGPPVPAHQAELQEALRDTLNMLRAAHMQCGVAHDSNKRVIKARGVLAKAEGKQA